MGRKELEVGEHGDFAELMIDGRYVVRVGYRNIDGTYKRYQESSKTSHRAARTKLRAKLRDWSDSSNEDVVSTTRIKVLADLVFVKLDDEVAYQNKSPGTPRLYRSVWNNHLKSRVGNLAVRELTVQRAERVIFDIAKQASLDTAKRAKILLSKIMKLARKYGAVPHNPMHDVDPVPNQVRKPPKALTSEEIGDLLIRLEGDEKAKQRDIPDIVLWMLGTSERRGNALAAAWDRIDLDRSVADLGPNVIRVSGKGLIVRGGGLSTKTREHMVGLPETLVRMLHVRWAVLGSNPTGLVFPNQRRTGPLDPDQVSKWLTEAMETAGYPWVTSHVFRKTVATVLDDAGVSPRQIADRLGHAGTAITQDLYMRRRPDSPTVTAALQAVLVKRTKVTRLAPTADDQAGSA